MTEPASTGFRPRGKVLTATRSRQGTRTVWARDNTANPPSVACLRAARALIGVSQAELARRSGVSSASIARLERYPDDLALPCRPKTWSRLVGAFAADGVVFVDDATLVGVLRHKAGDFGS